MDATVRIGSERYQYMLNDNLDRYEGKVICLFCDELEGYTFFPHSGKLTDFLLYREKRALFKNASIFLVEVTTGRRVKLPCRILELEKEIYINEDNFNKYWYSISSTICTAIRQNENAEEITQSAVNSMVNLTLLETPSRGAEINSEFKIIYKGREVDIETQRLISRRDKLLSDNRIKFVYAKSNNLLHDKSCKQVERIEYWNFEATDEFLSEREMCPCCRKRIYVRKAIKGVTKHFEWYMRFFENGNVNSKYLEQFLKGDNVSLHMDSINELVIKCNEDTWRIIRDEQGLYRLLHNNYVFLEDGTRYITDEFHLQIDSRTSLNWILHHIENYDWRIHVKEETDELKVDEEVLAEKVQPLEDAVESGGSLWSRLPAYIKRFLGIKSKEKV